MRFRTVLFALLAAGVTATCMAPEESGAGAVATGVRSEAAPPRAAAPWRVADHAADLAAASCPAGTARQSPLPIDLSVEPVTPGDPAQLAAQIPGNATLSGAWELSSSNSNFGGLSGLALLPASEGGGLLTVSDAGAFIWIDLEGGDPSASKIAYMQGADGAQLTGKKEGDAEGLVWSDGLALVSFERSFRIEAFALEACGSAARAARVATLPDTHNGRRIDDNQGPEALFLEPSGGLGFGYEGMLSVSPLGQLMPGGVADWTGARAPAPALHGLVAREIVTLADGSHHTIEMFRAWDPIRGNRIRVAWGPGEADALTLSRPLLVDNFEGLAAEPLPSGGVRVWIISDNNFSASQKTLLYAFDIEISQG